jgi:DNA polymerase III subunit gamma/tau
MHIIARNADGALRDALSIFDQIVSLCGKKITYRDVIENLNILDYEYYFKCVSGALKGDVSTLLITFNEILEKGFDGHNFISGLNSHLRDLLVSKDEITIDLLEATPSVKNRYLKQADECSVDFLYRALEIVSECDISYKSSKNTRLHTELALIKLCRITEEPASENQKKKNDEINPAIKEKEITPPPKSEIVRKEEEKERKFPAEKEQSEGKHIPVIEKPPRTFSIKDIISENEKKEDKSVELKEENVVENKYGDKIEFTENEFRKAWHEFVDSFKGEGTRVVSMFKSIQPDIEDEHTIRIHLSNATQRDLFVQNYKPKLTGLIRSRFRITELDIETSVDLTETNEVLYTDEQKYNYLQGKYPVLNDFRKAFNLDIN